jgi:polysaccharide biosynthesis/export protein
VSQSSPRSIDVAPQGLQVAALTDFLSSMKKENFRSKMRTTRFQIFLITLIAFLTSGTSVFGQTTAEERSPQSIVNENYRVGPGDILDVVVSKNDTLSRNGLRVSNKGTIQLPMLDSDVPAACLTERQLADAIKEKYRKYLVSPYVNVTVREFNSNPVAVIGAVNSPGRFQLQRPIRIAELLTFVNGPSTNAGRTIEIMRNSSRPYCEESRFVMPESGGEDLLTLTLEDAFKGGETANPLVRAGDIIRVTEAGQMNAYIQGNVKNGTAISLKDPVSLSQAIAMAGGLASGTQMEKIRIRRQISGSINREEIFVNLKEINKGVRDDVLLQANDIVEVPGPTGVKKVFQELFRSVVPMVTQLPTRVIY